MSDAKFLLNKINLTEYGLGIIKLPLTEEIIEYGENKLLELLTPFIIDYQQLEVNGAKFFDYLFIKDVQFQNLLVNLLSSLQFLYKTSEINIDVDLENNPYIYIIDTDININRNNYNKLCEVIKEMFFIIKPKENKPRAIEVSEGNKHLWEEYLELEKQYEKEKAEREKDNEKNLHQITTIVASKNLWDYDKVLNMTYYRLMNTYVSIFKIDSFTTYMRYSTSGQFDMKNQDVEHWTESVGK